MVRQALTTNPRLSVLLSNREAIDYELRRDRGLYLPQVDVEAGVGYQQYESTGSELTGNDDFLSREDYSVTLSQRLFDGFDAASRINRQKSRAESAAYRVNENAEFLALDAINAYLEVLRQRQLKVLAEENLAAHDAMLEKLQARADADAGSSADVVQTEARRSRSRATLFRIQNELRDAEANYKRVVGEHPTELDPPSFDPTTIPASWEDARVLAMENNPTEKIFEADIDVAKHEVGIAEANFYPRVNLEAEYGHRDDVDGDPQEIQNAQVMLRMRWNLYRGGSDEAEKRAALARVMEAKNRRYDAANGAVEEMRLSWNAYEITAERVRELTDAVGFNEETLTSYLDLFNVGQRSLLDVLDAENELFTSKGQLVTAQSNRISAAYRILAAGGKLLQTLDIEAPKQANPESPSFSDQVFGDQ